MEEKTHQVIMENREKLEITMCEEVISFNENEVVLNVFGQGMIIKGTKLKVNKVSGESGDVAITGECINSITYSGGVKGKKEGILRRIIK